MTDTGGIEAGVEVSIAHTVHSAGVTVIATALVGGDLDAIDVAIAAILRPRLFCKKEVDRAAYMISKFRHVSDRVTFRKEDDIDALTAWAIILHSEKRGGLRMQRDRHKQQKD